MSYFPNFPPITVVHPSPVSVGHPYFNFICEVLKYCVKLIIIDCQPNVNCEQRNLFKTSRVHCFTIWTSKWLNKFHYVLVRHPFRKMSSILYIYTKRRYHGSKTDNIAIWMWHIYIYTIYLKLLMFALFFYNNIIISVETYLDNSSRQYLFIFHLIYMQIIISIRKC